MSMCLVSFIRVVTDSDGVESERSYRSARSDRSNRSGAGFTRSRPLPARVEYGVMQKG